MNKSLEDVAEFHQTFKHPIGQIGEFEQLNIRQLRIKLLFEELAELAEASDCKMTMVQLCDKHVFNATNNESEIQEFEEERISTLTSLAFSMRLKDGDDVNLIEELDAICDIQYVLNGKIITAGLQDVFDKNFDLVHKNNMQKAHRDLKHAAKTIEYLRVEKASTDEFKLIEEQEVVLLYNQDGKLIKPFDHKKVTLQL